MGGSWFYSRVGNTSRVQDFIFLFLVLIKGTKGQCDVNQGSEGDGLKTFLHTRRDGKTLLRSSASCYKYSGVSECVEFVIVGRCRVKIV